MHNLIAEALILSIVILTITGMATSVLAPNVGIPESIYMTLKDAPPVLSGSNTSFCDLIMRSGNLNYNQMRILVYNTSNGALVDKLMYDQKKSEFSGSILKAEVNDVDGSFDPGDQLRLELQNPNSLRPNYYEIVVVYKDVVVYDGVIRVS